MDSSVDPSQNCTHERYRSLYDHRAGPGYVQTHANTQMYGEHGFATCDEYLPFDDFDRELLASTSLYDQDFASRNPAVEFGLRQGVSGDLQRHRTGYLQSGGSDYTSSDTSALSSPTTTMLRKKQDAIGMSLSRDRKSREIERPWEGAGGFKSLGISNHQAMQPSGTSEPMVRGIRLIPITRLPDMQKSLFRFKLFNAVQSRCFPTAYDTDYNLVVSAPTGSGKTVIMELAMLRLTHDMQKGDAKIVYMAPTKSLCSERCQDWQQKLNVFGLHCAELTGDTEYGDLNAVQKASVIVTTPEKWDSITRKWTDQSRLIRLIKLFLIDEVHVIGDSRGATVEAIVSRMKCASHNIRFVALSATIPNSDDIAAWLTKSSQDRNLPAVREVFDNSFRPVELIKHVVACDGPSNLWAFDNSLTEKIPDVVTRYGKGKPVMIFCATRESAQKTAIVLTDLRQPSTNNQARQNNAISRTPITNELLQKTLPAGIAFHHASLSLADRKAVEQGFLDGHINVICCTSTLAIGVNLPCFLVILKGTCGYTNNGLQEYSGLEIMQMLGRAGRPQFETEAYAVVLCHKLRREKYENMVAGEEIIESSLHHNLIEHMNAEISIGTIQDAASAQQWLQGTFLYVRLQKNAGYYNMNPNQQYRSTDEALLAWCEKDLNLLHDAKLIESSDHIKSTECGAAMAKYCVKFDTMKIFMALPEKAKMSDVLKALASAAEFQDFRLKPKEKRLYKEINKANETRYPIAVDIALPQHKVSLVIQAKLGGVEVDKSSSSIKIESIAGQMRQLQADTLYVFDHCKRLIRCLVDVVVQKDDSIGTKNALEMARSLAAQAWDDTFMQLKQIQGIGDVFARKLAAAGVKSVDALFNTEPRRIEVILSKNPPFGQTIHERASLFPLLHVSAKELVKKHIPMRGVEVKLRCEVGFVSERPATTFNRKGFKVLFVCETSSSKLLDFRCFPAAHVRTKQDFVLTVLLQEPAQTLTCHVMCDDVAGTHRFAGVHMACPSSWFPVRIPASASGAQAANRNRAIVLRDSTGDFGDDGLDDTELLNAVQNSVVNTDREVYDIDDILTIVEDDNQSKPDLKRSCSTRTDGDDLSQNSVRLPNGNWTCRHPCRDKNLDCKHPCCKEGVKKKPIKRSKKNDEPKPIANTDNQEGRGSRSAKAKDKNQSIEGFLTGSNKHFEGENATDQIFVPPTPENRSPYNVNARFDQNNKARDRACKDTKETQSTHHTDISAGEMIWESFDDSLREDSFGDVEDWFDLSKSTPNTQERTKSVETCRLRQVATDTPSHNQTLERERLKQPKLVDTLEEDLGSLSDFDWPDINHEIESHATGNSVKPSTSLNFSKNPVFNKRNKTSDTWTDKSGPCDIDGTYGHHAQHGQTTSSKSPTSDPKQKQYWDNLENNFLTHENFQFVTIIPDRQVT